MKTTIFYHFQTTTVTHLLKAALTWIDTHFFLSFYVLAAAGGCFLVHVILSTLKDMKNTNHPGYHG